MLPYKNSCLYLHIGFRVEVYILAAASALHLVGNLASYQKSYLKNLKGRM